jgi:uridine kinase
LANPPATLVVVDGLDGSGKSRFAALLAAALSSEGAPASLMHVDDFRRPLDFSGLAPGAEAALYYERYFDFAALDAALAQASGAQTGGAVTVLEGVMPLRATRAADAPLIVLEVSTDEARRRIVARDQAKGRTPEEIAGRIDRRYFPAQTRYRAAFDPFGRADLVIDNEDWGRPRVVRRNDARFPREVVAALDRLLPPG